MGSSSRLVLLTVNLLASILALAIVGLTLNAMYGKGAEIPQLAGMPISIYYAMLIFASIVFFVSILGVSGTCLHSKILTVLFIILDLLIALALLIVAIYALVYANGVTNVKEIDSNAKAFQTIVQQTLTTQATKQPDVWNVTQTTLGCCGIDLEATYGNYSALNLTSFGEFLDVLQPGAACAKGRAAVVAIHNSYSSYSSDAEKAADANADLKNYFCKDVIASFVQANTLYVGIIAAVLVLIQIATAASAIILLTKVTTVNGGFVPPPPETGNTLAYGAPHKKGGPEVSSYAAGNTLA